MTDPTYHFGKCDCMRPECVTARAVRRMAADTCQAAIVREFGAVETYEGCPHLSDFPSREWVCRAFPWRSDRPCPACGFTPWHAPVWANHGRVFGLAGQAFRIVSVGSTNRHAPNGLHSEDYVHAELISEAWSFPQLPAGVDEVGKALKQLFALPTFRVPELANAILSV